MKNNQHKKAPLSLEEQYKSIFPDIYTDDLEDENGEFWLAQPPAQKFVDSTTISPKCPPPKKSITG